MATVYVGSARIDENVKVWESTYTGQNVWEPGTPGIDERFWVKYTE